jgi:hypothetical protein
VSPPAEVLAVAESYAAAQSDLAEQAITALAVAIRSGRDAQGWRDAVASIATRLLALQTASAGMADDYLAAVLQAQGVTVATEAAVNPEGFADIADGGGSWLRTLVLAPISVLSATLAQGLGRDAAQSRMQLVASSIVLTGMQDTGRSSVQAAMFGHGANWYVRMLRPPSCARCAILAGRKYRSSQAFDRHKRCDCIHIPMAEDSDDWTTNPTRYFRSLTTGQQDRIFTKAGAQAIRDAGVRETAINQVVNARQGIQTVTAYGRQVQATTVGTTRRALFGRYEILPDGTLRRRSDAELDNLPGSRNRATRAPRLLPDEIYRLAEVFGWDRAEVLRQLRRFAYVL